MSEVENSGQNWCQIYPHQFAAEEISRSGGINRTRGDHVALSSALYELKVSSFQQMALKTKIDRIAICCLSSLIWVLDTQHNAEMSILTALFLTSRRVEINLKLSFI